MSPRRALYLSALIYSGSILALIPSLIRAGMF